MFEANEKLLWHNEMLLWDNKLFQANDSEMML